MTNIQQMKYFVSRDKVLFLGVADPVRDFEVRIYMLFE